MSAPRTAAVLLLCVSLADPRRAAAFEEETAPPSAGVVTALACVAGLPVMYGNILEIADGGGSTAPWIFFGLLVGGAELSIGGLFLSNEESDDTPWTAMAALLLALGTVNVALAGAGVVLHEPPPLVVAPMLIDGGDLGLGLSARF